MSKPTLPVSSRLPARIPAAKKPRPRPRAAAKSHLQRRAEIIEAALALAAEGGVARVTTQAIADRLGIAQATVFRHFKRRDAIFRAAMEWIGAAVMAELGPRFRSAEPADRRLAAVLAAHLRFIAAHRGIPRLLFSDRLHLEDPALKVAARQVMGRYGEALAGLLDEGVAAGVFRKDLDPAGIAALIVALIQGTVLRWSVADFAFSLEAQAEPLWDLLAPSLRRAEPSKSQSNRRF